MKKIIRIICLTLSVCMLSCMLFGCGEKKNDDKETSKFESDYRVELLNFENWYPDFSIIKMMRNFGKITRNVDENYVKSGKYSAKIQPIGGFNNYNEPCVFFPTDSAYYEFDYMDFTYADHVDFWIYNANDTEKVLKVGLVSEIKDYENITCLPATKFNLSKGWNLIKYVVDFNAMSITQKIDEETITQIRGVYLEFEHAVTASLEDAPVFYLDDMNIYYKEEANELKDSSKIIEFDANIAHNVYELCDFEKLYQQNIFSFITKSSKNNPVMSVVKAEDEGIDGFLATSGTKVLKVELTGSDYTSGYTELILSDKVVRAFYDKFVINYTTGKPIIPVEDWDKWYLAYDVYCDFDVEEINFSIANFFYQNGNNTSYRSSSSTAVKSNSWVTWSWSIKEIQNWENSRNEAGNPAAIEAYNKYKEYYDAHGYGERVSDAGQIRMVYSDMKDGKTRVMYIDNLRLYKA